jgi:adenylate cyclase
VTDAGEPGAPDRSVQTWIEHGLYDPDAPNAADRLELLRYTADHGISLEEMIARGREGTLSRAVVDDVLAMHPTATVAEVAQELGIDTDLVTRVWLALGFPPPPLDQPVVDEEELGLLRAFVLVLDLFGLEGALQFTRVLGSSIGRIAEAAVGSFLVNVEAPLVTDGAGEAARARTSAESAAMAQGLPDLFGGLYRRHFFLAVERSRATQGSAAHGTFHLTIGFCDLVGYTAWSRTLTNEALAKAVNDFEQAAHDLITAAGGRVVKSLGDAVLFATPEPGHAAQVALALTEVVERHPVLTSLRSALATGEVLGRDGDYYGPVVNLAARLVKEARPGSVVSDRPIVGGEDGRPFASRSLGALDLRGVGGPVELYAVSLA